MQICDDCQAPDACIEINHCLLKYLKSKDIVQPELNNNIELDDLPEVTNEDHSTFVVTNH